jgi:DNA topoisomerase III
MEVQMKAICDGRISRQEVVQQNLEQYRTVFNRTAQQMNVLKSVSLMKLLHLVCVVVSLM